MLYGPSSCLVPFGVDELTFKCLRIGNSDIEIDTVLTIELYTVGGAFVVPVVVHGHKIEAHAVQVHHAKYVGTQVLCRCWAGTYLLPSASLRFLSSNYTTLCNYNEWIWDLFLLKPTSTAN